MTRRLECLVLLGALHCFLWLYLVSPAPASSPEVPGAPQTGPIALIGGTVHPVSGPAIPGGTVLFAEGRLVQVGANAEIPRDAERIDVRGKHVYPGLFDAYTDLGLVEIDAVRATLDQRESGSVNPNAKSQVAVNPDSELIPVARANGVLMALTAPSGGLISGKSAVLQLDGWTWEDMTVRGDAAMHLQWPRMTPVSDWWESSSRRQQTQRRDNALEELENVFRDARAYRQARQANPDQPIDLRWEAMFPVLDGKLPVMIDADDAEQIQAAVAFALRHKIRIMILGGFDAPDCAPLLVQHQIPVIVAGVYRLPRGRSDAYDSAYTVPERLRAAGVRFCIASSGASNAANVRNLPYHAATAAAYGLPPDEALKAITLYPAQILGVGDRVGSLEPGKDATLMITDGDPLEVPTHVLAAYIQGRKVQLTSRHSRLWEKYRQKYQD